MLTVPFSSEEEGAEFGLGLGCRSQQALQVAGGNAGLVLGEVSTQRQGVEDGALGVLLTGEKAWGPWPAVSTVWDEASAFRERQHSRQSKARAQAGLRLHQ